MQPVPIQFVGIDVGKTELAVVIQPAGIRGTFPNTARGHRHLLKHLGPEPACIVLEATGRYHRAVHQALAAADRPAAVIDPARVHGFRISEGLKAKTDRLDAELLARYAEQKRPAPSPLPSPARTALTDWVRTRDFLLGQRQALLNRQAEMPTALQRGHGQLIRAYDRQIAAADQAIARIIATDPVLAAQAALLTSVSGIGDVTAAALLALLPELGTVSAKAIASLAGVAPRDNQSGKTDKRKHLRGGRGRLRQALYLAMLSTTRWDPVMRTHYQQLLARGKPKKVALLACARRTLGILNAMVREGLTWQQTAVGQGRFLPSPP